MSALAQLESTTVSTPSILISTHDGSRQGDVSPSSTAPPEQTSHGAGSSSRKGDPRSSLPPLDSTYPLHVAAASGHVACVEALLRAGCSVHLRDYGGRSPLFLAASGGHVEVVTALRGAGAHLGVGEGLEGAGAVSTEARGRSGSPASSREEKKRSKEAWDVAIG